MNLQDSAAKTVQSANIHIDYLQALIQNINTLLGKSASLEEENKKLKDELSAQKNVPTTVS